MLRQYPIKIYTIYKNQIPKMSFVQNDTESNRIYFEMYDDIDVPMTNINTATATIQRPDGKTYVYGSDCFVIEDNLVTFVLPPSAVTKDGECLASVSLYDGDYGRLSTQTFKFTVTKELMDESLEVFEEDTNYPVLTDLLRRTENLKSVYEGSMTANNNESQALLQVLNAKKTFDTLEHKIDDIDTKTATNTADINKNKTDITANANSISAIQTALSGKVDANTMTSSNASNGYQKFPSGLILQWGTVNINANTNSTNVTFTIPFPNVCLNVQVSNLYVSSTYLIWSTGIPTKTAVTSYVCKGDGTTPTINTSAYWYAIGY